MTIINQTQFQLEYDDSYFDSGRFAQAPTNVKPFSTYTFSACNRDGSLFCGATGGAAFKLRMPFDEPNQAGLDKLNMSVGFCAPYAGAYKASAIWSDSAQKAYDEAQEGTFKQTFFFAGKTKEEGAVQFCH